MPTFEVVSEFEPAGDQPKAIAELYEAWDITEPGNGYDAKATKWRQSVSGNSTSTSSPAE